MRVRLMVIALLTASFVSSAPHAQQSPIMAAMQDELRRSMARSCCGIS